VRRRTRSIVTLLGLGLGVALVIVISGLSSGLDQAQRKTLDPLGGIGTDLTVTLAPQQDQGGGFRGPNGGNRDLVQSNLSVVTDLSKLGKPGAHFVHDFFLPGTQLTFPQSAAKQISSISGVAQVTQGLTLLAEHQEGIVPKIVAKLKTGGQTFDFTRNIQRPTAAQFKANPLWKPLAPKVHEVSDTTWMTGVGLQGAWAILTDLAQTFDIPAPAKAS